MSAWIYLAIAIGFEVLGTAFLKVSNGFENFTWGSAALVAYGISFWFFAPALKTIPVGIAYAVWSGIGIAAIVGIGVLFFDQRLQLLQYGFISLILIGAVGLQLTSPE